MPRKKFDIHKLHAAGELLKSAAVDGDENANDQAVKMAVAVITADYYSDVRGMGDELIRQLKEGEITDREGFDQRLHEDVDSSGRIMYTWQAKLGLLATDYPDAYEEEMGEKPEGPGQQLFMAMEREVREYVEREVDLDDLFEGDD